MNAIAIVFAAVAAAAAQPRPARTALYAGAGSSPVSVFRWLELSSGADGFETFPVDGERIRAGALGGADLLVLPDGSPAAMCAALGAEGASAVRKFVESGGGLVATGGGTRLAMEPADDAPLAAGLLPFAAGEAGRGDAGADVMVHFNSRAAEFAGVGREDTRLLIAGEGVMLPSLPVTNGEVEVVATFAGDVNGHSAAARPSMSGQAAAVAGTYGKGRVFVFAALPERDAADHRALRGAVRYAARREALDWERPQRRRGQLAVGVACDAPFGADGAAFLLRLLRSGEFDLVPTDAKSLAGGGWRRLDAVLARRAARDCPVPAFEFCEAGVEALRRFAAEAPDGDGGPAAPPKVARPVRAAIYADKGGSNVPVATLLEYAPEYELTPVGAEDVRAGRLAEFDVLVQPGGLSKVQYDNLRREGADAIAAYVRGGGRYFGICAGAFLVSQPVPPTERGLSRLGLLPFRDDAPEHYRGWAPMEIEFTDEGAAALGVRGGKRTVMYWGGPAFLEDGPVPDSDVRVYARYAGRLVNTAWPGRVKDLHGKAAVVGGRVGKGMAIVTCPHPEKNTENMDVVRGALRRLTGVAPTEAYPPRRRGAASVFLRAAKDRRVAEFYLKDLLHDRRIDATAGSHLDVDALAHLDAVLLPAPNATDDPKDAPFLRRFEERGGTVLRGEECFSKNGIIPAK